MLTKILGSAFVVVLLFAIATEYRLIKETEEHAETKVRLEASNKALDNYQTAIIAINVQRTEDYQQNQDLVIKHAKTKRELKALMDRESTVLAKPGLVQIKINKSFNKQQARLACITGDTELCIKP